MKELKRIKWRICPTCSHVEQQETIRRAQYNFWCPVCQERRLSEYRPSWHTETIKLKVVG